MAEGKSLFQFKTIPQDAATSVWATVVAPADEVGPYWTPMTQVVFGVRVNHSKKSARQQRQPRFSPDVKGIVYPVREKGVANLWLQPLDGGPGRQMTNFASLKTYSYQWSPDGKSLALVRGDSPSDLVLIQNCPK
jgi:Tol biopolymer transport system component